LLISFCGLFGAVYESDQAFWWSSLSWLSLGTVFLMLGLHVEMLQYYNQIDRVYDSKVFVPVYCNNFTSSNNNKLSDVSFISCGLIIFLMMLGLWGIWVSVVSTPADIGVVIYTMSFIATFLYIKFGCGKTTLLIQKLILTGGFTDELIMQCCNDSLDAYSTHTVTTIDPTSTVKALDPIDAYNSVTEFASKRREAFELLNNEVEAQCTNLTFLSPIPLYGLVYSSVDQIAMDDSINKLNELYEDYIDMNTLWAEWIAYFKLTALFAARAQYTQHITSLLTFLHNNGNCNYSDFSEKNLLELNESDLLVIMNAYNQYLKSKEVELKISKKEQDRIIENQKRIEEERRRILELELTRRRQEEEDERKRKEIERLEKLAKEQELERLRREQQLEQERRDKELLELQLQKKEEERLKKLEEDRIRMEKEKYDREQLELRLKNEELERLEREKQLEAERLEREKQLEAERLEREKQLEAERLEREKLLAKLSQVERERLEAEEKHRKDWEAFMLKLQEDSARKESELVARLEQERRLALSKLEEVTFSIIFHQTL